MGVQWGRENLPIGNWARWAVFPAAVILIAGFKLRHAVSHGFLLGASEFLFDKWHLGPLRLVNFAAGATVLIFFQSILKPLAIRPLVMMGQSSLQVFCVHLLCCFAGLTLLGHASMLSGWKQFGLLTVTFAAMLVTAKLFSKVEAQQERQPSVEQPLGPGPQANPSAQTAAA